MRVLLLNHRLIFVYFRQNKVDPALCPDSGLGLLSGSVENDPPYERDGNEHKVHSERIRYIKERPEKAPKMQPEGKQKKNKRSKLGPYRYKIHALIDEHNISVVGIREGISVKNPVTFEQYEYGEIPIQGEGLGG
jgi:hypothetical protein